MYKNAIETALRIAAENGWNQTELGAVLGASSGVISNWKSRGLPAEQVAPVARALGVTMEHLLAGDIPETPVDIPYRHAALRNSLAYVSRLVDAMRFEDAADEAQVLVLALRAVARQTPAKMPSAPPDDLAAWVKAARAHAGLTLEQLGERLGRTKSNVGHWEAGKHEPSYRQVCEIARVTDYPLPGGAE